MTTEISKIITLIKSQDKFNITDLDFIKYYDLEKREVCEWLLEKSKLYNNYLKLQQDTIKQLFLKIFKYEDKKFLKYIFSNFIYFNKENLRKSIYKFLCINKEHENISKDMFYFLFKLIKIHNLKLKYIPLRNSLKNIVICKEKFKILLAYVISEFREEFIETYEIKNNDLLTNDISYLFLHKLEKQQIEHTEILLNCGENINIPENILDKLKKKNKQESVKFLERLIDENKLNLKKKENKKKLNNKSFNIDSLFDDFFLNLEENIRKQNINDLNLLIKSKYKINMYDKLEDILIESIKNNSFDVLNYISNKVIINMNIEKIKINISNELFKYIFDEIDNYIELKRLSSKNLLISIGKIFDVIDYNEDYGNKFELIINKIDEKITEKKDLATQYLFESYRILNNYFRKYFSSEDIFNSLMYILWDNDIENFKNILNLNILSRKHVDIINKDFLIINDLEDKYKKIINKKKQIFNEIYS